MSIYEISLRNNPRGEAQEIELFFKRYYFTACHDVVLYATSTISQYNANTKYLGIATEHIILYKYTLE